jgi:hypothetical protein
MNGLPVLSSLLTANPLFASRRRSAASACRRDESRLPGALSRIKLAKIRRNKKGSALQEQAASNVAWFRPAGRHPVCRQLVSVPVDGLASHAARTGSIPLQPGSCRWIVDSLGVLGRLPCRRSVLLLVVQPVIDGGRWPAFHPQDACQRRDAVPRLGRCPFCGTQFPFPFHPVHGVEGD